MMIVTDILTCFSTIPVSTYFESTAVLWKYCGTLNVNHTCKLQLPNSCLQAGNSKLSIQQQRFEPPPLGWQINACQTVQCNDSPAPLITLHLQVGITLLNHRQASWFQSAVVCNISGTLFTLGSQLSVFLIAVQCIVRCQSLVFPFRRADVKVIMVIILLYCLVSIGASVFPFLYSSSYKYYASYATCNYSISEIFPVSTWRYNLTLFIIVFLPFLGPAAPVVLSCCVSVFVLKRKSNRDLFSKRDVLSRRSHDATITILIITTIYILFNLPQWFYYSAWIINPDFITAIDPNELLYNFTTPMCVMVNAAVNPAVYVVRMRRVRQYFSTSLSNLKIKRGPTEAVSTTVCWFYTLNYAVYLFQNQNIW